MVTPIRPVEEYGPNYWSGFCENETTGSKMRIGQKTESVKTKLPVPETKRLIFAAFVSKVQCCFGRNWTFHNQAAEAFAGADRCFPRDGRKQSPHERVKSLLIFPGCFRRFFFHFFEGHPLRFLLLLLWSESEPPSWGRHFPLAEDSHAGTGDSVWQKVTVLKQTSARSAMFWIAVLSRTCMVSVSYRRGRKQLRHLVFLLTSLTVIC